MSEKKLIFNNPFSLNVNLPKKTLEEVKKVAKQEFEDNTLNPLVNYLGERDKVFSGEVASEIRKYQSQIYTLGQVMREGKSVSTFNMKM